MHIIDKQLYSLSYRKKVLQSPAKTKILCSPRFLSRFADIFADEFDDIIDTYIEDNCDADLKYLKECEIVGLEHWDISYEYASQVCYTTTFPDFTFPLEEEVIKEIEERTPEGDNYSYTLQDNLYEIFIEHYLKYLKRNFTLGFESHLGDIDLYIGGKKLDKWGIDLGNVNLFSEDYLRIVMHREEVIKIFYDNIVPILYSLNEEEAETILEAIKRYSSTEETYTIAEQLVIHNANEITYTTNRFVNDMLLLESCMPEIAKYISNPHIWADFVIEANLYSYK